MTEPDTGPMQPDEMGAAPGKASPGAELARQREARGWTIDHVARQLNLAPRQIQALEADNHSALPGMASVRGFIRAYAKLLKIEAEPLLVSIPGHTETVISEPIPMRPALSAPFSDGSRLGSGRGWPWKNTVLLVFVAAVLAGAYLGDREGWFQAKAPAPAARKAEVTPPPAPQAATGATEASGDKLPAQVDTAPPPVTAAEPAAPAVSPESKAEPTATSAPAAAAPVAPAPASTSAPSSSKQDELVMSFREESWLEVQRIGKNGKPGEMLAGRLVPAGATLSFDMSQPVSIVIGNVNGTDVQLRGQPVHLKEIGKTNVSRFTLK